MKVFRKILSVLLVFLIFCASFALMGSIALQHAVTPENLQSALTPEALEELIAHADLSDIEEEMALPAGFLTGMMQTQPFSEVLGAYLSDMFETMLTGTKVETMTSQEAVSLIQEAFTDTEQKMNVSISPLKKSILCSTMAGQLKSAVSNAANSQIPLEEHFWFGVEIAHALLMGPVQLILLFGMAVLTVLLCLCQKNWYSWTLMDGAAFVVSGLFFLLMGSILFHVITDAILPTYTYATIVWNIASAAASRASIAGLVTLGLGIALIAAYVLVRRHRRTRAPHPDDFSIKG